VADSVSSAQPTLLTLVGLIKFGRCHSADTPSTSGRPLRVESLLWNKNSPCESLARLLFIHCSTTEVGTGQFVSQGQYSYVLEHRVACSHGSVTLERAP
jgi:hypothetical protein